ncbi:transcription factor GATA-4, partial [Coprinopsis cinerea okayama7
MTAAQPMMYDSMTSYNFDESQWPNDAASITSKRYTWGEDTRRSSPTDMSSVRFQQAYLSSDLRTTISPVDSPAYQPLLLPNDNGLLPSISTNAHVPRGLGYIDSSPSTDSDEAPEPTASSQWHNSYNYPYNGRASPNPRMSRSSTSSPDWSGGLNLQIPFDSNWMMPQMDSAVTPYSATQQAMSLNGLIFPNRFSPVSTPSPPPLYQESILPSRTTHSSPRVKNDTPGVKKCSHCQATSTPLWRRDPSTFKPLCNACGLYLQQRNRLRPQELIDADTDDGNTTDDS